MCYFLDPETGPQALLTLLFLSLGFLLLSDFQSTKAFFISKPIVINFAYKLNTTFSTISPCRIFKLSPD